MDDLELAVETGKLAFASCEKPPQGPMGEYCIHLQVPDGTYPIWVTATRRQTKKGIRYRVSRVFMPFDGSRPDAATDKVAELVCDCKWLVIGDLIFLHDRDPRGADKTDCSYNRAMAAIRRGHSLGGVYSTESGDGVALRIGLKEARLPVRLQIANGRPVGIIVDIDPASALPRE